VTKGGPGDKAGLQVGDVVTKVGNQLITQDSDLVAAIRSFTPGATVDVTYTRAGASHTVKVTTGTAAS
jgi:putative serine protease PepD